LEAGHRSSTEGAGFPEKLLSEASQDGAAES
jgi:hypothetical protein